MGTYEDIKAVGLTLEQGIRLRFYDEDGDELGRPDDLLFEGTVHFMPAKGWGAVIDASTFHWESDEREASELNR